MDRLGTRICCEQWFDTLLSSDMLLQKRKCTCTCTCIYDYSSKQSLNTRMNKGCTCCDHCVKCLLTAVNYISSWKMAQVLLSIEK